MATRDYSSDNDAGAAKLPGFQVELAREAPMRLDSGETIGPFTTAYTTGGERNAEKSNAILVCHALTGDKYVLETHPLTGKPGWWDLMVGPGKPLDTDRYFILCVNVLGGCMGSTGPSDINPETGEHWGLDFPVITIGDMVRAQAFLLAHLGIDQLFCAIGGSMGAKQVPEWAAEYPHPTVSAVPTAVCARPWV